jgi:predicted kinase|tara:strand:- start:1070 stop:1864 length:795 start_codon:yes stop_codon:yes gene_type:complete
MVTLIQLLKEVSANPKALILSGAPGAGKSSLLEKVKGQALILNIDDYYIDNLKKANVSLDLKNASPEDRSKAAKAMMAANKEFRPLVKKTIEGKENIIFDQTSASYKKTRALKDELEDLGYDVMMAYVFASVEKSLDRNETRFERSKGEDRSLPPAIVFRTWNEVTKNFVPYSELFGNMFVPVVNDKKPFTDKSVEELVKTYLDPYKPTGTKPKTEKEIERSRLQKEKLNQEITDFINSKQTQYIIDNSITKKEARNKIENFFK